MTKPVSFEGADSSDNSVGSRVNFGIVDCMPSPQVLRELLEQTGGSAASRYLSPLEIVDRSEHRGTTNGGDDAFANMSREENVRHAASALFERWMEFKRDMKWVNDPDIRLARTERRGAGH